MALPVISMDQTAAVVFDQLRASKGLRKLGHADLLISSVALAQRATLVTRNLKHFQQVPGLHLQNWMG